MACSAVVPSTVRASTACIVHLHIISSISHTVMEYGNVPSCVMQGAQPRSRSRIQVLKSSNAPSGIAAGGMGASQSRSQVGGECWLVQFRTNDEATTHDQLIYSTETAVPARHSQLVMCLVIQQGHICCICLTFLLFYPCLQVLPAAEHGGASSTLRDLWSGRSGFQGSCLCVPTFGNPEWHGSLHLCTSAAMQSHVHSSVLHPPIACTHD